MPNDIITTLPFSPVLIRSGLPAPGPLYIRPGDQLGFLQYLAQSGVSENVQYTAYIMGTDGRVQVHVWNLDMSTTSNSLYVDPGEGLLLSMTAQSTLNNALSGQLYIEVVIVAADPLVTMVVAQVMAGYLRPLSYLSFPGGTQHQMGEGPGALRSVLGSVPAAGAEISQTVATYGRWKLRGMTFTLVTAAAAATRQVHVQITDGTNVLADFPAATTQIISLTRTYFAAAYGYAPGLIAADIYIPIPPDLLLMGYWKITTVTDNINAGDAYSAPRFMLEEWMAL